MKKFYFALLLSVFSVKSFSQLIPSTIGEVYNFEVGDTMEYYSETHLGDGFHSYAYGYMLITITSKYSNGDTIKYSYQSSTQITSASFPYLASIEGPFFTGGNHNDYISPPLTLTKLDSSIFIRFDYSCQNPFCFDSVAENAAYNFRKQNMHNDHNLGVWVETFVAGVGLVSGGYFIESQGDSYGQTLIYYHKANGETWGTPQYFVLNGINNLEESSIKISPNPTSSIFQIKLSKEPHRQTYFKLYDALGREVKQELISSATTTLNRENLSNGIYFWQVEAEACLPDRQGKIMERGKIIFE